MILHVDANTFYASCERLFRPDLDGKPIAVLSNNDGIIIALNQECKDLGFQRGDAYFKLKAECEKKGVTIFSSNYTLYADISARLNAIYNQFCPDVEVYSIDESFLLYPDWINVDFQTLGTELRNKTIQATHIPVSIGAAPTKTLAKICNKLAKKRGGVCFWDNLEKDKELFNISAGDIWGIGYSKAKLLYSMGIKTALDLKYFPLDKAKKYLSITGYHTVQELNEQPAMVIQEQRNRDNISTSKSFAKGVRDIEELEAALCEYTTLAIERMHREKSTCRIISVFLGTARDFSGLHPEKQYFNYASGILEFPSNYLPTILTAAKQLLHQIYRESYAYRKVQISLLDLHPEESPQQSLFYTEEDIIKEKSNAIMKVFSQVNEKYGRGCLHLGVRDQTKKTGWLMNRDFLSPSYTTRLSEVPIITD